MLIAPPGNVLTPRPDCAFHLWPIYQSYRFVFGDIQNFLDWLGSFLKFFFIFFGKFLKSLFFMVKPFSKGSGRSDVFHPLVYVGIFLAHSPRPHAIYQNSNAIVLGRLFINSFDPNFHNKINSIFKFSFLNPSFPFLPLSINLGKICAADIWGASTFSIPSPQ